MDQRTNIKLSLDKTIRRIRELVDAEVNTEEEGHSIRLIIESLRNTIFWRNLTLLLEGRQSYAEFEIPNPLYEAPTDIKKEFIRGFADVAGSARYSNRDETGRCRIYLDVMNQNWLLPVQICNFLQRDLKTPVRAIAWGHPNIRDPNLREYRKKRREVWAREHQIKIYAEYFMPVGFYMSHKQTILEELAGYNERHFKSSPGFCTPPKNQSRRKSKHPEEKSNKLPEAIRDKHYDAYWQICCDVGCLICAEQRRMRMRLPEI